MCDNERLCAMEPCFTIERIFSSDGLNPSTTVLLGQCLTYGDTRAPSSDWKLWNYEKEGANEKGNIKRQ